MILSNFHIFLSVFSFTSQGNCKNSDPQKHGYLARPNTKKRAWLLINFLADTQCTSTIGSLLGLSIAENGTVHFNNNAPLQYDTNGLWARNTPPPTTGVEPHLLIRQVNGRWGWDWRHGERKCCVVCEYPNALKKP